MAQIFNFLFLVGLSIFFALETEAFELKGTSIFGKSIEIKAEASGEYMVLVFLSNRCPCSRSHEASIARLAKEFGSAHFSFVGLLSNSTETTKELEEHFLKADFSFPLLDDRDRQYADRFKAYKTPHVFVLDHNGSLLYQGGVSDSRNFARAKNYYLETALNQIKQGKKVEPKVTRSLGCEIYR